MRIGIRYCGGCNPRYDRGAVTDALHRFGEPEHRVETARPEESYDVIVLMSGCPAACAAEAPGDECARVCRINGPEDLKHCEVKQFG